MRIAILEDEIPVAEDIKNKIRNSKVPSSYKTEISVFRNGAELIGAEKSFDVIFADYKLENNENGMDVIRTVRETDKNVKVVFLTNYPEYVFESFKLDTFRYIIKPVKEEDLDEALLQIVKNYYNSMLIRVGEKSKVTYINAKDIKYAESNKRYSYFNIGDSRIFINKSISDIEEILNPMFFFRISRFFIVNFDYVENISATSVTMQGGKVLAVSRMKQAELKKRYLQYLKNKN